MRLWRLARAAYKALDGEGARIAGGRWSSVGTPVVYASTHLSLAALEILVHTDPDDIPSDFLAIEIEVDDASVGPRIDPLTLPDDWTVQADNAACRAIGDNWIRDGAHLALAVPSAVVPAETNVLINPRHPRMAASVAVLGEALFNFDARLSRR
jgi:RES domain-containing protein